VQDTSHVGFEDAKTALDFILSGNAVFTLTSARTGKHITCKVRQKTDTLNTGDKTPFFVSVLDGPLSWDNFQYIGFIPEPSDIDPIRLVAGRKGRPDLPAFAALQWTLKHLVAGDLPEDLTVQHEGTCGRCNRALTDPESISRGLGPHCAKLV
jgi:hypothetical protein